MTETMRIGTRASALATTQSQLVADQITELTGRKTELVAIATHGDTVAGSLASLGGTGVFVGVSVGVAVGGTAVLVGVAVGGTGVSVGVAVGGTGVSVGVAVGSCWHAVTLTSSMARPA